MNKALLHPRYWLTWLGLGLLRLLALLPYAVAIYLGKAIGLLAFYGLKRRRHIAQVNIDLCFPEKTPNQRQRLVKDTLVANGIGIIEGLYSWWAADSQILPRTHIVGLELLQKAKDNGQGVILLGAHFTTLDFCGRALAQNTTMDTMYQTQSNAVVDYCLKKARLKRYKNVLEKFEMRRLLKNLKSGHVCWYACDQDFGRENSVFVPFFGVPAATLATLGRLIKLTKAKPLMVRHYRDSSQGLGKSQYRIEIIDPFIEAPLDSDDIQNAIKINKALEQAIRIQPDQYFWVHRRFKKRPDPNEPNPYR